MGTINILIKWKDDKLSILTEKYKRAKIIIQNVTSRRRNTIKAILNYMANINIQRAFKFFSNTRFLSLSIFSIPSVFAVNKQQMWKKKN